MPFDYTGSFSGSFYGDITASNGVISSSAQLIANLPSGVLSSSAQVNYNDLQRKPTTISPFQASSIIANSNFRENTFPTVSASIADDINDAKQILTLNGRTLSISFGNSVLLPEGGGSGGGSIWSTGSYAPTSESLASGSFDFYLTQNNLVVTGSLSVTRPITGSLYGTADTASFISDSFISASVVRSGFGSDMQISGSTLEGDNVDGQFKTIIFDSSTGLHVTASNATTALVSIGSHFRDIIVNGQTTLVATGSDQLELVSGNGLTIETSIEDSNGNSVSKELLFRLDTSSAHFINAVNDLGLFRVTGSVYSTTNDLEITGSVEVNGLFKLTEFSSLPTAEGGAIAYSSSTFWFGVD